MVSAVVSHLHPAARAVLDQSEAERTAWLRTERWIGYPRAHQALTILEDLLSLPVRQRMPNLLIIGPTAVYLHTADKYHRLTHRLSQGQKGIAERARMASQRSSEPW